MMKEVVAVLILMVVGMMTICLTSFLGYYHRTVGASSYT